MSKNRKRDKKTFARVHKNAQQPEYNATKHDIPEFVSTLFIRHCIHLDAASFIIATKSLTYKSHSNQINFLGYGRTHRLVVAILCVYIVALAVLIFGSRHNSFSCA